MILTTSLMLLCSVFSGGNLHDDFYPNVVRLSQENVNLPTLVCLDVDDDTYFFNNTFEMSCNLWYDNEGNYRLDSFHFSLYSECYTFNSNNNQYVFVYGNTLDYTPSWSFTQNSYASELDNTTFRVFIDDDDTYTLIAYYNGVGQVYSEEGCNAFYNNYQLDISLNTSQFFKQVQAYTSSAEFGVDNSEYQRGYSDGFRDADNQNSTAVTIFSGILNIGLLPVNFFLSILNFDVFGINIGGFVTGLLSIAIVVIIVRFIFGSK